MNIHETNGRSVTNVLPAGSLDATRRDLMAMRVAYGADSPVGHRCSNIIELIQNAEAISGADRERCIRFIGRQMADLEKFRAQSN